MYLLGNHWEAQPAGSLSPLSSPSRRPQLPQVLGDGYNAHKRDAGSSYPVGLPAVGLVLRASRGQAQPATEKYLVQNSLGSAPAR
jgi:hypothetical protein